MTDSERNAETTQWADTQFETLGLSAAAHAEMLTRQAVRAGALLRQMRYTAGSDPVLLASALKITPQKIQALEEGRLEDLPGLTFARGLASALCRCYGVDPKPVLSLMPQALPGVRTSSDSDHSHEPVFKPSVFFDKENSSVIQAGINPAMPRWILSVVGVLVVGALIIWFLPNQWVTAGQRLASNWHLMSTPTQDATTSGSTGSVPASPSESASASVAATNSVASVAVAAQTATTATASASAQQLAVSTRPSDQPQTTSANGTNGMAGTASTTGTTGVIGNVADQVLSFNANGHVWLAVRDGKGKSVFDRILNKGDAYNIGGQLPLTVTVGDKSAITVLVRGQPVDLEPHTVRGLVARFTIDGSQTQ